MAHIPKDPWLRSMHALHVGSRPNALPCREEEYARVLKCVGELLEEGSGGCICSLYILSLVMSDDSVYDQISLEFQEQERQRQSTLLYGN
jgi:hypothetical protein